MLRFFTALAVGFVLLAVPSSASAGWKIDRATAIAAQVWKSPCGGQVTLRWAEPPAGLEWNGAWAYPEACVIEFNLRVHLDWPRFCHIMIHEYGHLAGAGHSTNPRSVMADQLHTEPRRVRTVDGWVWWPYLRTDRRCAGRGVRYLGL